MKEKSVIERLIEGNIREIICAIIVVLIVVVLNLFPALIIEQYVDAFSIKLNIEAFYRLLVLFAIVTIVLYVGENFKNCFVYNTALRITNKLREQLYMKNMKAGQAFYNRFSTGEIIEYMENDIDVIEQFIVQTLIPVFSNFVTIVAVLYIFFREDLVIGVFFLLFVTITFSIIYIVQRMESDCILKERDSSTKLTSFWDEILSLMIEIKSMSKWGAIEKRIESLMDDLKKCQISKTNYLYRVWITSLICIGLANIVAFLIGGILFFKGQISIGTVYLIYTYSNQLRAPMENMQLHLQNCSIVKNSLRRINDMFFYEDYISDGVKELKGKEQDIEFCNINYRFGSSLVLDNVSFKIDSNQTIGIFGESGAGKSTIGKILCKLYEPQEGSVLLNGIPIQEFSVKSVREQIAYITPNEQIFEDSLKNNLLLFRDVDDDILINFIKENNLQRFLGLASNDNMIIKNRLYGLVVPDEMSLGEKQLLNALRAIFSEKSILIFDEAVASLDEDIEKQFFELLRLATNKHTSVIITHNVERLSWCDKILVMQKGKVLEYGSQEELIKREDSIYFRASKLRWRNE